MADADTVAVIKRPDTAGIAAERESLVAEAGGIAVADKPSNTRAATVLVAIAKMTVAIEDKFRPAKAAAHAAHRQVCALESEVLAPLRQARSDLQGRMIVYEAAARRAAEAEERRLAEVARRAEEERQLAEAVAAEQAGDSGLAERILAESPLVPTVTVAPQVADVRGVSDRVSWRAKVTDLLALVKWVAGNPMYLEFLEANQAKLNQRASFMKRLNLLVPGVEGEMSVTKSVRT